MLRLPNCSHIILCIIFYLNNTYLIFYFKNKTSSKYIVSISLKKVQRYSTVKTATNEIFVNCGYSVDKTSVSIKTRLTLHNCLIHAHGIVMMLFDNTISLPHDRQNGLQTGYFEATLHKLLLLEIGGAYVQGRIYNKYT